MSPRPTLPDACSVRWDEPGLPCWGTAPRAVFTVLLEQPGPWGAKAFTHSRLDPEVGRALEDECASAGGRAQLVRTVGRPPAPGREPGVRRVFVAGRAAGVPWLLAGECADPRQLLTLPLDRLGPAGPDEVVTAAPWLAPAPDPLLLVCTNGQRDVCCALRGRPLAEELAERAPRQVWEANHIGGHRFSPTALVLPTGQLLGRLTADLAADALDAAARGETLAVSGRHDRGRGWTSPPVQVAESLVRVASGERRPGLLTGAETGREDDRILVEMSHADGRKWRVGVRSEPRPPARPDSCGKALVDSHVWTGTIEAAWRAGDRPHGAR